MGDVGDVSLALKSIGDLIGGMLDRNDRDAPDKELNDNIIQIQNGFANNDELALGILVQLLLTKAGNPATPSRDPGIYRREIFHSLLLSTAQLIHERELVARFIANQQKVSK